MEIPLAPMSRLMVFRSRSIPVSGPARSDRQKNAKNSALMRFRLRTMMATTAALLVASIAPVRALSLSFASSISGITTNTVALSPGVALLKPASGHSQPLFGPPDPYLSAGKSIAPSTSALMETGMRSNEITPTAGPGASTALGAQVIDAGQILSRDTLPGFVPHGGGFLATHNSAVPLETPATFAAQVEWSAQFLHVIDVLPLIAFLYALVEFFVLRPNLDWYREEVVQPQNPGMVMDTATAMGTRVAIFAMLAVITDIIFG